MRQDTESQGDTLTIEERAVSGIAILDLKGQLTEDEGERVFRQKLDEVIERPQTRILLNFIDVGHLDSSGVGAVAWKYITLRRQGGALKLVGLQPRARKVLSATKLLSVFDAFESEAEAVASFDRG